MNDTLFHSTWITTSNISSLQQIDLGRLATNSLLRSTAAALATLFTFHFVQSYRFGLFFALLYKIYCVLRWEATNFPMQT